MFFVSFQKWTVIVDTTGHNYSNDKCPWWTVIVEKSTIVVQWTVIVAAATISVHGGQLSLMDSYRCYIHNGEIVFLVKLQVFISDSNFFQ